MNSRSSELPSFVRYNKHISPMAKIIYCELSSYIDVSPFFNIKPSDIAKDYDIDIEEVKNYLIELNSNGLLKRNEKNMFYLVSKNDDMSKKIEIIHTLWNEQDIIKHTHINSQTKVIIEKRIEEHGFEKVKEGIINYGIVCHDESYFFNHKWSLYNFLKQLNALPNFFNEGDRWINYKRTLKSDKKQITPEQYLREKGYQK